MTHPDLDTLYDAVLSRPPGEREDFLKANCPDAQLRRQVQARLAAAAGHRRVGPFVVHRALGKGGGGRVFLACRQDRPDEPIALKLPAGGQGAARAQLEAEQRLLAALRHPNIVRWLDGGRLEDGSPFLVLEYVKGRPITDYCRHRPIHTALELFLSVCHAVQYLHGRGVVHGDLTPHNILVAADGTVRIVDFGNASAYEDEAGKPIQARPGTPGYAAPEQRDGAAMTPAVDVYALGVVLGELVRGWPADAAEPSAVPVDGVLPEPPESGPSPAADGSVLRGDSLRALKVLQALCQNASAGDPARRPAVGELGVAVAQELKKMSPDRRA